MQFKNKKTLQDEVDEYAAGLGDNIGGRRREHAINQHEVKRIVYCRSYGAGCSIFSLHHDQLPGFFHPNAHEIDLRKNKLFQEELAGMMRLSPQKTMFLRNSLVHTQFS